MVGKISGGGGRGKGVRLECGAELIELLGLDVFVRGLSSFSRLVSAGVFFGVLKCGFW